MGPKPKGKAASVATAEGSDKPEPSRKRTRKAVQQPEHEQEQTANDASEEPPSSKAAKPRKGTTGKQAKNPKASAAAGDSEDADSKPAKAAKPAKSSAAAGKSAEKPEFYLVKSEPHEFSIEELQDRPQQTEGWEGVRNAQARNFMRGMRVGDLAFFYHSSCKVPGIVGIAKVVHEAYPDPTQHDPSSKYHDPKSSKDDPKWWMVDFQLVRKLSRQITLEELKGHKDGALSGMALFNRPRLSVQPVTRGQWEFVLSLEEGQAADEA